MKTRQRFDELDGYRGIAALLIVVYHAYQNVQDPQGRWLYYYAG